MTEWVRAMPARNLSARTIRTYADSAAQLLVHARATAGVSEVLELERGHVQDFLSHLAARRRPVTVSVRYRELQQLFAWLIEEEIERSPMERMKPPIVRRSRLPSWSPVPPGVC